MFTQGQRVWSVDGKSAGFVHNYEGGVVYVTWDDNPGVTAAENPGHLSEEQVLRGPSYVADIVHEAMLRYARNAGAAVTALEIIRREAKNTLENYDASDWQAKERGLVFIEKFCGDVLSQVLPA